MGGGRADGLLRLGRHEHVGPYKPLGGLSILRCVRCKQLGEPLKLPVMLRRPFPFNRFRLGRAEGGPGWGRRNHYVEVGSV